MDGSGRRIAGHSQECSVDGPDVEGHMRRETFAATVLSQRAASSHNMLCYPNRSGNSPDSRMPRAPSAPVILTHKPESDVPLKSAPLTPTGPQMSTGSLPLSTCSSGARRRQAEFHELFKSILQEEVLLDTYACALSREILVQGRMYVGEQHVCFHANIIGWVTSVVIAFSDIVSIDKRSTALIFQNAIQIATMQHTYFFTSFLTRDAAYQRLRDAWQSHFLKAKESRPPKEPNVIKEDVFADDIIADDLSLANPNDSATKANCASNTSQEAMVDNVCASCGCNVHYGTVFVNRTLRASFLQVSNLFYADEASLPFFMQFSKSISSALLDSDLKPIEVESSASLRWLKTADGAERRTFTLRMPLPHLTAKLSDHVLVTINETRNFGTDNASVIGCVIAIDGMPGGRCTVNAKVCLSAMGTMKCKMLVTGTVEPSKSAWFKESIQRAITAHIAALYHEMARAAEEQCSFEFDSGIGSNDSARKKTLKSKLLRWCQLPFVSSPVHRRASPNIGRHGVRAFLQNMLSSWPIALSVFLAVFGIVLFKVFFSKHSHALIQCKHDSRREREEAARLHLIDSVYSQLHSFLDEQNSQSNSFLSHAINIIAHTSDQLSDITESDTEEAS